MFQQIHCQLTKTFHAMKYETMWFSLSFPKQFDTYYVIGHGLAGKNIH